MSRGTVNTTRHEEGQNSTIKTLIICICDLLNRLTQRLRMAVTDTVVV